MRKLILMVLLFVPIAAGQDDQPARLGFWGQDILFAAKRLPSLHKDIFRNVSKEKWKSTAISFSRKMGEKTSPAEFIANLMRLVALVGDSHTAVRWSDMGFPILPLFFVEYADGIVVQKFPRDETILKGAHLLAVEGRPVEEVIEALRPLVAYDNEVAFRRNALQLLTVPDLLRAVGIGKNDNTEPHGVTLSLRSPEGNNFDHLVQAIPRARLVGAPVGAPSPPPSSMPSR